jgi:hypothetical protein
MITEISVAVIGAVAAITVSLVGFIVAVTSAVIAKEQKVSEFRLAWIEGLRNDISELISLSYSAATETAYNEIQKNTVNIQGHIIPQAVVIFGKVNSLAIKIKLRLNEHEHKLLIQSIKDLIKYHTDKKIDLHKLFNQQTDIQKLSHTLLKNEWEVVKKGEKHFIFFRGLGEVCLWGLITALLVLALSANFPQYCPIVG